MIFTGRSFTIAINMVTPTPDDNPVHPFLQIAENLFNRRLPEEDQSAAVADLPLLNEDILNELAQLAETAALTQPAYAYTLMTVADAAARHSNDPFLCALAAWQLARAANGWVQPKLVETAVTRAQTLFTQLQEPGWLAACSWQRNATPWTRPNFPQAVAELEQSLRALEQEGFHRLVPECRLSLAYAYILVGRFDDAETETAVAQQTFEMNNDLFGVARCYYTLASYLRRQTHFEQARDCFAEAQHFFQQLGAEVWNVMTTAQLGLVAWYWQHDAQTAEPKLKWAVAEFEKLDLPLWVAQGRFGLGQMYQQMGQLSAAAEAIHYARETFARFHISGLWADSLLDSGWLALYQGKYQTSLDFFQQAETLYGKVGNSWLPVIAIMHQGEAYVQMGQYQQALHYLEKASQHLEALEMPQRQAWCQIRLAAVHELLNHWSQAETHLDKAEESYGQTGQVSNSSTVYNLRAKLCFAQGKVAEALQFLHLAMDAAEQQGEQPEVAQAQRLLGHTLCEVGRLDEALHYLQKADSSFATMGMMIDRAACQIELGDYYSRKNDYAAAETVWKQALSIITGAAPELEWRVHLGLAGLAEAANDGVTALAAYRQAVAALAQLRRTLWQPAVAGSYLAKPMSLFDRAVSLATKMKATRDVLYFIEESKAQTIAKQLVTPASTGLSLPSQVTDLIAEIRWLQQKISESKSSGPGSFVSVRELHQQFLHKVRSYDQLVSQVERAQKSSPQLGKTSGKFDLTHFRKLAADFVGKKWLVLNFYQNEAEITAVAITSTDCFSWSTPITPALNFALDRCSKAGINRSLSLRNLTPLGTDLLPKAVSDRLTPDTHLLIVPHKKLHRLPWAALPVAGAKPLVAVCIPTVIPSLQSLLSLWQRPQAAKRDRHTPGLLIAVANFQGRHPPLVEVNREAETFTALFGPGVQALIGADAVVEAWRHLQQEQGTTRFGFLHIATHAFSDQFTGRLSSLALYDRDLWLDELQQFAPLPPLVTLSACSGLRNLIHEGDEQTGLSIACLSAGAQRVVGSLWPILDKSSPNFMRDFYQGLLGGYGVAEALVWAQRTAVQTGTDLMHWASFQCIGQP